jgi:hypothetical protein
MRSPAAALLAAFALLLAVPRSAAPQEPLPPPPPPPSDEPVPLPPPPPGTREIPRGERAPVAPAPGAPTRERTAGTIGQAPFVAGGSQAAPLHPDLEVSPWRLALATGVAGRFGGFQVSSRRENRSVLLYFGGQADGVWTEGYGRTARLRLRMFTGGESQVYIPSDGEVEAAYMIGRPEFHFVVGRIEVGRYPGLAVGTLAQVATLPTVEGSVPLLGDSMRLYYYVSPVEAAWVYYYGGQHIEHSSGWTTESDRPVASTAARLRWTVLLPPSVILSVQGDFLKMWNRADLLLSGEGSLGVQILEQTVVFNAVIRWDSYTRRGVAQNTEATSSEVKLLGLATLVF